MTAQTACTSSATEEKAPVTEERKRPRLPSRCRADACDEQLDYRSAAVPASRPRPPSSHSLVRCFCLQWSRSAACAVQGVCCVLVTIGITAALERETILQHYKLGTDRRISPQIMRIVYIPHFYCEMPRGLAVYKPLFSVVTTEIPGTVLGENSNAVTSRCDQYL